MFKRAAPHHARSILITGASSGLGKALALHYAHQNIFLALHGRDKERLSAVARACRAQGAQVHTGLFDITDSSALTAWMQDCDQIRPLDLVIANAGISGGTGTENRESGDQAAQIFEVNVTGVIHTIENALSLMAPRRYGQIALMSSLASFSGWPGAPAYSASKAAVRLYGEALRPLWAGRGLKVNVICPGFVKTPMTAINNFPMPFLQEPEKAASLIAQGLQENKHRIAFPYLLYSCVRFIGLLPAGLIMPWLAKMPAKPATHKK